MFASTLSKHLFLKTLEQKPTRDGYGEGVCEAGDKNPNIVVLCCDLTESTRSNLFAKKFPERFIEVGIAEQNMASMAAGLALEGKIPFIASYAVFSPGRNWDMIRVSVCYNNVPVKIVGAHAGISVGPDGATHQALEDIALMRVLPRMQVIVPCDALEAKKATVAIAQTPSPSYIRILREATPVMTSAKTPFKIGRAEIFWRSAKPKIAFIACGSQVYDALLAAKQLEKKNIGSIVINNHTIKPLDEKTLLKACAEVSGIVTLEEHQKTGGLFGAVSELFSEKMPKRILSVSVNDSFGESGTPEQLLNHFGITANQALKLANKILK